MCCCCFFVFFLLPQLFIVRTHYALSILLLCSVFAYVMFHVSLYFFYRVIFCYFLFVSDIQTISSMQTLFSLKFGAYFFLFSIENNNKIAQICFVFSISLFFVIGMFYYEFQCFWYVNIGTFPLRNVAIGHSTSSLANYVCVSFQ